jgi:hypothetical protein
MKEATITLPEEIDEALDAYGRDHGMTDALGSVVEEALRGFLQERGYLVRPGQIAPIEQEGEDAFRALLADRRAEIPFRPFRITPIHHEGEIDDISINHDRYFADGELGRSR